MKPFVLIAGPCSLESQSICRQVAETLRLVQDRFPDVRVFFKGSFDKANRTSLDSPRGPGMVEGLNLLRWVRDEFKLPTLTDFHLPEQAGAVSQAVDVLQIPAFLCRQTDLLVAAAETGRIVNVKKGQFVSPQEMEFVVKKLESSHASEIWLTERGTFFGYNNLVVDMRSFSIMNPWGHTTIFDATHSVQIPGAGGKSGGRREFVAPLAKAAIAAGANGLFIETHPNPAQAISDADSQIPLAEFPHLIAECLGLWQHLQATSKTSPTS